MNGDSTPAWTAWSSLPEQSRREVDHLAKLGLRHPDRAVAEAAGGWAVVLLASADREQAERWWRRGFLAVAALLTFWDPLVLAEAADTRFERVWAEQVLAANAGTSSRRTASPSRWSPQERQRQLRVLAPVMLCLALILVVLAVLATRNGN
jgi:hypothetical protein